MYVMHPGASVPATTAFSEPRSKTASMFLSRRVNNCMTEQACKTTLAMLVLQCVDRQCSSGQGQCCGKEKKESSANSVRNVQRCQ